jgi:hypothetical protein
LTATAGADSFCSPAPRTFADPAVADALPGRVDYLTLWPLTQGEIEGRREDFLDKLFGGEVPMLTDAPVGRGE